MFAQIAEQPVGVTLYTDSYVVRGYVTSRHRRVTDILNTAVEAFIVLSDVTMDEWGSTATPVRADFAQVNLASVLFAVADEVVEPTPELRMPKITEQAFITVPPFRVVGTIHLPPEQNMRLALNELTGRFLPVTDATFWSDTVGEGKQSAVMVAVNHSRAQILAPHTDVDPWVGLDRSNHLADEGGKGFAPGATLTPEPAPAAPPPGPIAAAPETPPRDAWGVPLAPGTVDPWGSAISQDAWAPAAAPAQPAVPGLPSVPPSRTGLLGRVHGTGGMGASMDLPRPVDDMPDAARPDRD
jgi:hypothetical protein